MLHFFILKDIEDPFKSDAHICEKYSNVFLTEDFKQKIREFKTGPNEFSLLHIAAKNCRKIFCLFLIQEIKIGNLRMAFIKRAMDKIFNEL